jgi:hypothetical protein
MLNKILTILIVFTFAAGARAQNYNTGIGIRAGFSKGFSYKQFISPGGAFEFIAASRWEGISVTGLFELHNDFNNENFRWYYGAGAHVAFWNTLTDKWFGYTANQNIVGVDAILGIEYNFSEIPFNISLDYKPGYNLNGKSQPFYGDEVGFTLRYVFGSR